MIIIMIINDDDDDDSNNNKNIKNKNNNMLICTIWPTLTNLIWYDLIFNGDNRIKSQRTNNFEWTQ